jgi:hypothetical protein
MKMNSAVVITSLFLLMMMGAGSVSAMFGYKLGYESLKGVSQPNVNPTRKLRDAETSETENKGLVLVDERKILVKNYDYIDAHKNKKKTNTNEVKNEDKPAKETQESEEKDKKEQVLALKTENQAILLEAVKISEEDVSLLLNVNLQNNGNRAVRFVYSFLEIKDDKNKILSAIAEGLPSELPANGNKFSGTVRIPLSLLRESEKLSLTLTDYPDQKIQLKIDNIPVLKEQEQE